MVDRLTSAPSGQRSTSVRIGCGSGFWGDWLEAPIQLATKGALDYLILDYLAEVTMSILAKQKERDPNAGYARDFVDSIERILPQIDQQGLKVLSNAGGMNPRACAEALLARAKQHRISLKVAIIEGDDLLPRLDALQQAGESLVNFDDGRALATIRADVRSANVYLGSEPLHEALRQGAQVVITGRVADSALALAPLRAEFGWGDEEWDLLAAGTIAGHVIECGAQVTGGNCSIDWEAIPDLAAIGYPIVEVSPDGSFIVTKPAGTGGRVSVAGVKEQLLYEIGDPRAYVVPDVCADFTALSLTQLDEDRVRVTGAKGHPRPEKLKLSLSYFAGYSASGTLVFSWPDAYRKARCAGEIIASRLQTLGLQFERVHCEVIGGNACHGSVGEVDLADLPEAMLRVAVRGTHRASVERFTREVAPLVLSGPPSATAYAGGKRQVSELVAYWPALVSRTQIAPSVTIVS